MNDRRWTGWVALAFSGLLAAPPPASAQAPADARSELRAHLASLERQLEDKQFNIQAREGIALEMAATLDRAAQSAPSSEARRGHWSEASAIIDKFEAANPGHPKARLFQFQSAVYVWARARTWLQALDDNPLDLDAKKHAIAELEECVKRLGPLYNAILNEHEPYEQNVRFRYAQARADLSELAPMESAEREIANREALDALGRKPYTEAALVGFAFVLQAEILGRLGRFPEANALLDHAEKVSPRPSDPEIFGVRLNLLMGAHSYDDARKAIEKAPVDAPSKPVLRARVAIAERAGTSVIARRKSAESALFEDLKLLGNSPRPDARAALIAAALALPEPDEDQPPEAWDCLAAGALFAGDRERAGKLERKGADLADKKNNREQAAEYRLRAGAYFFQAEKFAEADPLLLRLADDEKAGLVRARAGMLLALSRGRALALKKPEASEASYKRALERQIKNFPDDATADEARWLLGKLKLATSDRPAAIALWTLIRHGQPRWLDSRIEIAQLRQQDLDAQRLVGDRPTVDQTLADAREFLADSLKEASSEPETNSLRLASARLELTPGIGRPSEATRHLEAIQHSAARPIERESARRLMILANAHANRWIEVERAAGLESAATPPAEMMPLIRLVDRAAAEADSDLRARRLGYVNRLLLRRALDRPDQLEPALRAEVHLRQVRALLFSGDEAGARRVLSEGREPLPSSGDDFLRDLADIYMRTGAYALAEDVQRLRARKLAAGSFPWFDARYGLALAAYRAGHAREAVQLIDGTTILHPNLGGETLRDKFHRLRQRIDPSQ